MADLKTLKEWGGHFTKMESVQPSSSIQGDSGNFLSGESAVVVAGPASLEGESKVGGAVIPIGMVQQTQLSQNKQINQIFEIGGRVPFFVPGRVSISASLSKILFDGPSLAYALYRSGDTVGERIKVPALGKVDVYDKPTNPYTITTKEENSDGKKVSVPRVTPGDNDGLFWINLASRIFNKPIGLGFMLYDMEGEAYGGAYLEGCYLNSHRFGISANATVLAENVSLVAKRIKPISAASMGKAGETAKS